MNRKGRQEEKDINIFRWRNMRTKIPNCDIDKKETRGNLTGRVRSHTYDFLTLPQR